MKKSIFKILNSLLWLQFFIAGIAYAQTEPLQWTGDGLDDLNWKAENETSSRIITEDQDELRSHPLNLNLASEEDLLKIPGLNGFQRGKLLAYLKDYGELLSIYELLAVQGFDSCLIEKIAPFIRFLPVSRLAPLTLKNIFRYGKSEVLVQAGTIFPRSKGYSVPDKGNEGDIINSYPGSPFGMSFRYTFSYSDRLAIGFSADKDAGEQFFAGAQKYGMDYYSGYLSVSAGKILKRLIIGNFRAGWGLGLTFNTGSSLGIYPGFNQEFSGSSGIHPTQSVSESNILRGIAVSLGAGHFTLSGICSYRKRDATVTEEDPENGNATVFSSFIETGYHRTLAEINKKGKVTEFILGGNLNFRGNFFSLGVTAYSVSLSARFQPRTELYNYFTFMGRNNFVTGADFNCFYRFFRLSGEVSRSANGNIAWIAGLNLNPDPRFSAVILYRCYPPDFQNLYSNCFSQSSYCSNEKAWFLSLSASLPWRYNLSLFADFCSFPWVRFNIGMPSTSNDLGALLTWPLNKNLNLIWRYMYSSANANNIQADEIIHGTGDESSEDFRFQLNWTVSQAVTLQSRIEIKKTKQNLQSVSSGWLLFQDISLKPLSFPLKIVFRYSVFDCPFYSARIWAYEPDVLYGYSMPAYYGQGIRTCLFIRYAPGRRWVFSIKAGLTRYNDKDVIGSGLDLIDANWRLDLTAQLRVRI